MQVDFFFCNKKAIVINKQKKKKAWKNKVAGIFIASH